MVTLLFFLTFLAAQSNLWAQSPFYQGKTITVIAASSAGTPVLPQVAGPLRPGPEPAGVSAPVAASPEASFTPAPGRARQPATGGGGVFHAGSGSVVWQPAARCGGAGGRPGSAAAAPNRES